MRMPGRCLSLHSVAALVLLSAAAPYSALSDAAVSPRSAVQVPEGKFRPLYGFGKKEIREYRVGAFFIDRYPVTRGEFLEFVRKYPDWSKARVAPIYADDGYLKDLKKSHRQTRHPVTWVSWYAAQAFCEARGGRLPTVLEWEYAAAASETKPNAMEDPVFVERILRWYAEPSGLGTLRPVGSGAANYYGIHDLHGLVWEWTADFNSVFVTGDNRQDGDKSLASVCGAGATDASSRSDYAAFMRYATRSSVEARYSQANLGFRCAYDSNGGSR